MSDSIQEKNEMQPFQMHFRTIMDTCADPIVVYDQAGRTMYINPAFTRVFGWTEDEVLKEQIHFVPEAEMASTGEAIGRLMGGETIYDFQTLRLTRNRGIIPVQLSAAPLKTRDGKIEGLVVNLQDISALKKAEKQARDKAAEASRLKGEFLSNMSHEIRTPMNAILGMAALMKETDLTEEQQEYMRGISVSSENLLNLINNILDFSKIEARKLGLETIPFNLRHTVEGVIDTLSGPAFEKGLELIGHIRPGTPEFLVGDPGRLRQILLNIGGNAIKFTEKGEVLIECSLEKEGDETVILHFTVTDSGVGIPPDKIDLVFEGFMQADGSVARQYGGTGLGLSIARRLVEMMRGTIWAENRKHGGARFHFLIVFGLQNRVTEERDASDFKLQGKRLLIVDENPSNRILIQEMLCREKVDCDLCADGAETIERIRQSLDDGRAYDLLLLDINLPDMDGFELCRRIRADLDYDALKIVILTSMGHRGDGVRCKELDISGYLLKPIKQSDLVEAVQAVLLNNQSETGRRNSLVTQHTLQERKKNISMRILLVEDNAVSQLMTVKLLEKLGHDVLVSESIEKTVALFQKSPADIILLDMEMPQVSGMETVGRIRAMEQTERGEGEPRRVPIIAMTTEAIREEREKFLDAGVDDCLIKPIQPESLQKMLSRWKNTRIASERPFPEKKGRLPLRGKDRLPLNLEEALERAAGDKAFYIDLVQDFASQLPEKLEQMQSYLETGDLQQLAGLTHSAKGAAATLGAERIAAVCAAIEHHAQANKSGACETLLIRFENEIYLLNSFIRKTDWQEE